MTIAQTIAPAELAAIRAFRERAVLDPAITVRRPTITARWLGSSAAELEHGDLRLRLGGSDEFNAMQALLGSLAACDIELITMRAALLGIEIENVEIEVDGTFDIARLLGIESSADPGYSEIGYRVHITTRADAPAEVAELFQRLCEQDSPVGRSLGGSATMAGTVSVTSSAAPAGRP